MHEFVWPWLPTIGSLLVAAIMFGAQVGPDAAVSNLAKWVEWAGVRAPRWLRSRSADAYAIKYGRAGLVLLVLLSVVGWGYYFYGPHRDVSKSIVPTLTAFVAEGETIKSEWVLHGDSQQMAVRFNDWSGRVTNFITGVMGGELAAKFQAARGSSRTTCPPVRDPGGCTYFREIDGKKQVLNQWIVEIRALR